jgi:hypothetical protein
MPSTESADDALSRKVAAMSTVLMEPNGASGEVPKPREHAADKSIANIYAQNQIWKNKKLDEDKDFFKKLGAGHSVSDLSTGWLDVRLARQSFTETVQYVPHNLSLFEISSLILCGSVSDLSTGWLDVRLVRQSFTKTAQCSSQSFSF